MNQNRNQNRRRGRGSNRGQGGGSQGNRIDSRARGNAPQMLEKYRKLAHDASLNGDRVQTEYYLQFADHYFRVVADSRTQKDDQRPRRDDRDSSYDGDDYDGDEPDQARQGSRRDNDRDNDSDRDNNRDNDRDNDRDSAGNRTPDEGVRAAEGDDGEENPFTREQRPARPRSRGRGRSAGEPANGADRKDEDSGFDPGVLPPAIGRSEEAEARPARSRRRARPADDAGDEALEAVS